MERAIEIYIHQNEFLKVVAELVLRYGFHPTNSEKSTSDRAWRSFTLASDVVQVSDKAVFVAKSTSRFIQEFSDKDLKDEFKSSLYDVHKDHFVSRFNVGIYTYAIKMFLDHVEYLRSNKYTTKHYGTIKDRVRLVAKNTHITEVEGKFGIILYISFQDDVGHRFIIKMKKDKNVCVVGKYYYIFGTIKKHDEYKGVKQTRLTQCNIKDVSNVIGRKCNIAENC